MKLKPIMLMLISLFSIGFATSTTPAGAQVADTDSDGVPDVFDNCVTVANGPIAGDCGAQQDENGDTFGDACDGDFNNDNLVTGVDFGLWFACFSGGPDTQGCDMNCDGLVTADDFGLWFQQYDKGQPGL